jgi:hypothetical protein
LVLFEEVELVEFIFVEEVGLVGLVVAEVVELGIEEGKGVARLLETMSVCCHLMSTPKAFTDIPDVVKTPSLNYYW